MILRRFLTALAALVLVATAVHAAFYTKPASSQVVSPQRLYIMFLPGLCGPSSSNCASRIDASGRGRATFHTLINTLARAGVAYQPLYYGFNPDHPAVYSPADTRQAISRSVFALDRQLRAVRRQDPKAIFDLAGYSLGGVIAANWTATLARPTRAVHGMLRYLHSIVTLDSPLLGIRTPGYGIAAQFFGGDVWNNLQPDSAVITAITSLPGSWWKSRVHLHTVANTADRIVPPSESLLGEGHVVTDRSCRDTFLSITLCHGAVMDDVKLGRFIACRWMTSADQCVVKPTSTPTPRATATPTSTLRASATPTPTLSTPPPPP
jgi:hypothetical protein